MHHNTKRIALYLKAFSSAFGRPDAVKGISFDGRYHVSALRRTTLATNDQMYQLYDYLTVSLTFGITDWRSGDLSWKEKMIEVR